MQKSTKDARASRADSNLIPAARIFAGAIALCAGVAIAAAFSGESASTSSANACAGHADEGQARVFAPSCATRGCHTATDRAGSLDLESPNASDRLVDVPSNECGNQTLVVPNDSTGS